MNALSVLSYQDSRSPTPLFAFIESVSEYAGSIAERVLDRTVKTKASACAYYCYQWSTCPWSGCYDPSMTEFRCYDNCHGGAQDWCFLRCGDFCYTDFCP
jgi:hypothetical protein